jgi:hypothetical protein
MGSGACVVQNGVVDFDTPTAAVPVPVMNTECFECTNGVGTEWECVSQEWQIAATFSCSP